MNKKTLNVVTLGSCMSEGVFAAITKLNPGINFNHLNHVIHNRSDYIHQVFIQKNWLPPDLSISELCDITSSPEFPNQSLKENFDFFLMNQHPKTIGLNRNEQRLPLLVNLEQKEIDLVLLDNFMDIASMIVVQKSTGKKFFLFSGAFSKDVFEKNFEWIGFLTPDESLRNWEAIVTWLKLLQPNAKFIFSPFPESVFGNNHRDSVQRASQFKNVLSNNPLPLNILNTKCVEESDLLSATDWCHYSNKYYEALAKQIRLL